MFKLAGLRGMAAILLMAAGGCAKSRLEPSAATELPVRPEVSTPAAITPLIDYHTHLLGPYALPVETPPPEVAVPAELQRVLAERAKFFEAPPSAAALPDVFTPDALMLDGYIDKRWMRGEDEFIRFLSLWKGAKTRFASYAYRLDGGTAYVAGAVVGSTSGKPFMNFLVALSRGTDGRWRIASETITEKKPPTFTEPVTAEKLVADLDKAGIRRALVLSEAFWLGTAGSEKIRRLNPSSDRVSAVQQENDWAAGEVARHSDRLALACGVNPLEDHAVGELRRCARLLRAKAMKMNLGEGGDNVDLHDPVHVAKLRDFFSAANALRMPIVVHMGSRGSYGREEVRTFLEQVVSAAPDIPIQIAHMSSGFQHPEALTAFADARASGDPLARRLYFDLSVGSFKNLAPDQARLIAESIRKIGLEHVLYASDVLPGDHHAPTGEHWADIRRNLPLTDEEFSAIADNIAPHMQP
jgi:predicted TIM-barrel fold metal-dependent hydrolase